MNRVFVIILIIMMSMIYVLSGWALPEGVVASLELGKVITQNKEEIKQILPFVIFSHNGKIIASRSCYQERMELWDVKTLKKLATFEAPFDCDSSIAFSPDDSMIVSASYDGTVKLWDTKTFKNIAMLKGYAFDLNGNMIAIGCSDKTVKFLNLKTLKESATLGGFSRNAKTIVFSPNGSIIAVATVYDTNYSKVTLCDVNTSKGTVILVDALTSISFSPDGNLLATSEGYFSFSEGKGKKTIIWDIKKPLKPEKLATLEGHTDWVYSAVFNPSGSLIATGSRDGTIKLWDAKTFKDIATLRNPSGGVSSVAFSPDGNLLASGGEEDGTILLWDMKPYNKTGIEPK